MIVSAALDSPIDVFSSAASQRALLAVLLIAVLSGALGWAIVLRDLPFFTHAVSTGAYPALVLGIVLGVSLALSALIGALAFAGVLAVIAGLGTRRGSRQSSGMTDAVTGLAVVGALALGSVLAATVGAGESQLSAEPEDLLFGTPGAIDLATLATLAVVVVFAVSMSWALGDRWLTGGFDPGVADRLGASRSDLVLYLCIALACAVALPATGALLVGALLIAPAASVRILAQNVKPMPAWTCLLASAYGLLGLYLALALELPSGAAIAAVSGVGFFLIAGFARLRSLRRPLASVLVAGALLLSMLALTGCGGDPAKVGSSADEKVELIATSPQVAAIARAVGGQVVAVKVLERPPRRPVPQATLEQLREADVIFRAGPGIDGWIIPLLRAAKSTKLPVDLSRSVVLTEDSSGAIDRRWFDDRQNIARAAQRIRDELVKAAPGARETFRANTTKLLDQHE